MEQTALEILARKYPNAKRTTLRRMLAEGRVMAGGQVVRRANQIIAESDKLTVNESPRRQTPSRPGIAPLVKVYEDADVVVVNKPGGLLTSTTAREKRATAVGLLEKHYAPERAVRIGVIHRLDRDAAGLLVFSKNDAAYRSLKAQFFHHTVDRIYRAVVRDMPNPPEGTIETYLVECKDGTVRSTRQHGRGQRAFTRYRVLAIGSEKSLVEVVLETGRKHQIRVHLSERGCPIVGDSVYGEADEGPLMLTAVALAFDHPRTGRRVRFNVDAGFQFP